VAVEQILIVMKIFVAALVGVLPIVLNSRVVQHQVVIEVPDL